MFNVTFYNNFNSNDVPSVQERYCKSLKNCNGLFMNSNITSQELMKSDIALDSITDGVQMFTYCTNLESFTSDLSSLKDGRGMFSGCMSLTSFDSDLSSLKDGTSMFLYCMELESFTSSLNSLENGNTMFAINSNLKYINTNMPKLKIMDGMFIACDALESFTGDLSNTISAHEMFGNIIINGTYCPNLTSFTGDLSSLKFGYCMFWNCTNLTSFTGDLSSLICGGAMFQKTKLNPQSVSIIVNTVKDVKEQKLAYQNGQCELLTYDQSGKPSGISGFTVNNTYVFVLEPRGQSMLSIINPIYTDQQYSYFQFNAKAFGLLTIGIDVTYNGELKIEQQLTDFAKEVGFNSWNDLNQAFIDKGWDVDWQYGGTSISIPFDLRNRQKVQNPPVYTKLTELNPKSDIEKKSAKYTSQDGTKFYNIEWCHNTTNPDKFNLFPSIQDACQYYGIIPNEQPPITKEQIKKLLKLH